MEHSSFFTRAISHIKHVNGAGIFYITIIFGLGATYKGMSDKMDHLFDEFGGIKTKVEIVDSRLASLEEATKMVDRLDARLLSTTTGRTWYQDSVNTERDRQVVFIRQQLEGNKRRQDTLKVAIDRMTKILIWNDRRDK